MYIEKKKKFNRKKSGYVLLEVIVILMIVSCICMMVNKIILNNYLKSKVVETREDIKTLSPNEEEVLLESIIYFNNNGNGEYKVNKPNDGIDNIIVNRNSGVLIKEKSNGKAYIEIAIKDYIIDGVRVINIVPDFYKTEYIISK